MIETGLALERYTGMPSVYAGGSLRGLPHEKRWDIADAVSRKLQVHKNTMIRYSAHRLIQAINEGRAAAILDSTGAPSAFAQYWPYKFENDGDANVKELKGKEVFEVGSWMSFGQSQGKKVFEACLAVGKMQHSDAKFIAIVEQENDLAAHQLREMGGVEIGKKYTVLVEGRGDSPAEVVIYDMNQKLGNQINS